MFLRHILFAAAVANIPITATPAIEISVTRAIHDKINHLEAKLGSIPSAFPADLETVLERSLRRLLKIDRSDEGGHEKTASVMNLVRGVEKESRRPKKTKKLHLSKTYWKKTKSAARSDETDKIALRLKRSPDSDDEEDDDDGDEDGDDDKVKRGGRPSYYNSYEASDDGTNIVYKLNGQVVNVRPSESRVTMSPAEIANLETSIQDYVNSVLANPWGFTGGLKPRASKVGGRTGMWGKILSIKDNVLDAVESIYNAIDGRIRQAWRHLKKEFNSAVEKITGKKPRRKIGDMKDKISKRVKDKMKKKRTKGRNSPKEDGEEGEKKGEDAKEEDKEEKGDEKDEKEG